MDEILSVTIQMKATEQYFHVVLFTVLFKVFLVFEYVDEVLKCDEQYFHVVLFTSLFKVVLAFESVDEMIKCEHSNESYWAVLSLGTGYLAVQGGSSF